MENRDVPAGGGPALSSPSRKGQHTPGNTSLAGQLCGCVLAPQYLSHVYQALSHLVHRFSPPLCSGTSSLGCPQRSPLHHSIRKGKMTGKLPPGGGEVIRRKNLRLSIVLWSVEQPLRCSRVKPHGAKVEIPPAPTECRPSPHIQIFGILLTKSEKSVVIKIQYAM